MEPPAKRRRQSFSPFNSSDPLGAEPETDEDTSPHPDPVETEDDGYQLAIKRMQATQKFQATFAHIIEKYSQNFDGIGDEIDMETGEIVVNNGHLSHMRHEADIGGGWTDHHMEDAADDVNEDDGFVFEDFIDGFSDDEDQNEHQDENDENKGKGGLDNDEPSDEHRPEEETAEEESIEEESTTATENNAIVPISNPGAVALPQNLQVGQVANTASLLSSFYGSLFMGFIPAFGQMNGTALPQMASATLPFNFGAPPNGQASPFPFMFNPWAAAGLLPPPSWGQMDVSKQSPHGWGQPSPPAPLQLPPPPSTEKPKGERYKFPIQRGNTSIWAPNSRQEDDNSPPKRRGRTPKSQGRKVNRLQSSPSESERRATNKDSIQASDTDCENRRMSGRVRKQVEYMGKISWLEADKSTVEEESSQQSMSDAEGNSSSDEGQVDEEVGEPMVSTPAKSTQSPKQPTNANLGHVIPDSQDSATPPTSSAPQPPSSSQTKKEPTRSNAVTENIENSIFTLSDDEAPLALPPNTTDVLNSSAKPVPETSNQEELISPPVSEPSQVHLTPEPPKKRPRGRPRKRPLDSPGDNTDPNHTVNPTAEVPASSVKRCKRDVKWLNERLPKPPDSLIPTDSDRTGDSIQHQTQSSPTVRRSTRSKTLPDSQESTVDLEQEPRDHQTDSLALIANPPATEQAPTPPVEQMSPEIQNAPEPPPSLPATEDETSVNPSEDDVALPVPEEQPVPQSPSSKEHTPTHNSAPNTPQKPTPTRLAPPKPQTPRNSTIRTSRAPSSRRSLLSLVSNQDDSDSDKDLDELGHNHSFRPSPFGPRSTGTSTRKTWRSSVLTREVYRTPVKKRTNEPVSPSSVIRTPGGTVRTCGVDGYQCGRDFCFTCL